MTSSGEPTADDARRYESEQAFHDDRYSEEVRVGLDRWYAITRPSAEHYESSIRKVRPGDRTLELGCGVGTSAFDIALAGAYPTSIDISPVAIEVAEGTAVERGIEGAAFVVMNAEDLSAFPDDHFDNVHGRGVLHHLDLGKTLPQVARVLKPGGRFVFFEPMGHNAAINAFRRRTPEMRTVDEHPLMKTDLDLVRRHFPNARFRHYHLTSLVAGALPSAIRKRIGGQLARLLEALDSLLLRLPGVRQWGWMVVVEAPAPH